MFLRISKFCASTWLLGAGDGRRHPLVLDRHVVGHLERLQHPLDDVGLEQPHQVVAQRQVEPALARVALTAGAAAQLVVDPAGLVPLGADHVEPAQLDDLVVLGRDLLLELGQQLRVAASRTPRSARPGRCPCSRSVVVGQELGVAAQDDVGAAAGHVGGHRDRALAPGQGDDRRLPLVLLGVQHLVLDAGLLQHRGQDLRLGHARGADQHRLALLVPLGHVGSTMASNLASSVR